MTGDELFWMLCLQCLLYVVVGRLSFELGHEMGRGKGWMQGFEECRSVLYEKLVKAKEDCENKLERSKMREET